ncbi:alpha/beta hydrolase [Polaribacter vadi]|uniref:alpha/beta fold hydrolase n=1 Tax=Polaribacter TaxID=52959 RepID=UPI001C0A3D6D|nr:MULTISPECIES: alpha/beta hydrolase [Polaribacter]MBU3012543.1 alpha/beta hydrolase [Polaribacter vadi]MDO6742360.1 alpha/beta hydrolase [Polaribacter sp. 1_MG-2023]
MINLKEWEEKHKSIILSNEKLSFIDTEIKKNTLLIIHGFGSSSFEFYKIISDLEKHYRIVIVDLIGFGLSSKPKNYYNSILDHAQNILELIKYLNITTFSVLSHGFGTSIFCELLNIVESYALKIKIEEIFLLNGSLTVEATKNKTAQDIIENEITNKFIKITISYEFFKKYYKESLGKDDAISDEDFKILWLLQNKNNGGKVISFIDYSIKERKLYSEKWINILKLHHNNIHIIWGNNDVLSPVLSAQKLQKYLNVNKINFIEDCGHFPMLEKPKQLSEFILSLKK